MKNIFIPYHMDSCFAMGRPGSGLVAGMPHAHVTGCVSGESDS